MLDTFDGVQTFIKDSWGASGVEKGQRKQQQADSAMVGRSCGGGATLQGGGGSAANMAASVTG